jgi:hypothetical protein
MALPTAGTSYGSVATATEVEGDLLEQIFQQAAKRRVSLSPIEYTDIHTELPAEVVEESECTVSGSMDCLAIGSRREVIIDHKSGGAIDLQAGAARCVGQLLTYAKPCEAHIFGCYVLEDGNQLHCARKILHRAAIGGC